MDLEIVHQDEWIVAVNKPYGYLTHKSKIDPYATEIVLQQLRDQINKYVYPIHRLDRKTTGVLLFGLNADTHRQMSKLFQENKIKKTYFAVVRGYFLGKGEIDYNLVNEAGNSQVAITGYENISISECPWPSGKFETSRYSLMKMSPLTGRMHQIRRHLSHVFHPIIGDRPHGCSKQNRIFKKLHGYTEMLLHAESIEFSHPVTNQLVRIQADFHSNYLKMLEVIGLSLPMEKIEGVQ